MKCQDCDIDSDDSNCGYTIMDGFGYLCCNCWDKRREIEV